MRRIGVLATAWSLASCNAVFGLDEVGTRAGAPDGGAGAAGGNGGCTPQDLDINGSFEAYQVPTGAPDGWQLETDTTATKIEAGYLGAAVKTAGTHGAAYVALRRRQLTLAAGQRVAVSGWAQVIDNPATAPGLVLHWESDSVEPIAMAYFDFGSTWHQAEHSACVPFHPGAGGAGGHDGSAYLELSYNGDGSTVPTVDFDEIRLTVADCGCP